MKRGFTVLEFLIAIGIIALLIALVLVGLNRVRSNSREQEIISRVQTVTLGVQQFYDICKEYPEDLTGNETCPALSDQNKTILDFLPELNQLKFNQSGSSYFYTGTGDTTCIGFHIGVELKEAITSPGINDSNYNSQGEECQGGNHGFDGVSYEIFDIKR